ncbi:MAG: beta-Ala-His dipeptidase [Clostridia bacterium]|nr:beta-Ala-His dipeptidase [Clostridia bacterium]
MNRTVVSFDKVMEQFLAVSAIPRGSGNEAAVASYIENFAAERGYFCLRDEWNNVFCRRPAAPGYEDAVPVVLQGHTDMVCEANAGTAHDFTKDPIRVLVDGDIMHADGTTLGADNGVAVAIMLALLDEKKLAAPALECIFTTSEETGLDGMRNFDASVVTGRRMINMDSAGEGEATVACAGGVRTDLEKAISMEALPAGYTVLKIGISGLAGGHSGEDIHRGRLPAVVGMSRLLSAAAAVCDLRLAEIRGGTKDNAIARECTAVIAVSDKTAAEEAIETMRKTISARLVPEDMGCTVVLCEDEAAVCCTKEDTVTLLSLLQVLPLGVRSMSREIPDLVETSANLGVIRLGEGRLKMTLSSRSSVETELDRMQTILESCASLTGASFRHRNRYPGWAFRTGSRMQECYRETWKALYGTEAKIIGIHAGLECGLFMEKVPDMDIISIGPDIRNLHSPDETCTVSSFERLYKLVAEMLESLR